MIEILRDFLEEWHKKNEIINEYRRRTGLKIDERRFRKIIQEHNKSFADAETDLFIAHDCYKGYKLTSDKDEILASIRDNYKRSITQLTGFYKTKERVAELNQLSLEDKEVNLYEVLQIMGN